MSEAELHILKARMRGGQLNKAKRGELEMRPPVGLVYVAEGTLGLDPDMQVQRALRLVFETFDQTGSAVQTVRFFREQGLMFPRRLLTGSNKGELLWAPPQHSRILQVLHNPRYAEYLKGLDTRQLTSLYDLGKKLFSDFFHSKPSTTIWVVAQGLTKTDSEERRRFFRLMQIEWFPDGGPRKLPIQLILLGHQDLEVDIRAVFNSPVPKIATTPVKLQDDIDRYIMTKITRSHQLQLLKLEDPWIYRNIVTKLCNGHGGNFLWATLMIREISEDYNTEDMINALRNLPKGVEQLYKQKLEHLSLSGKLRPGEILDLNSLLSWVTCSFQPLSLAQLKVLLSLRTTIGKGAFDLDCLIAHRYGSLFTLVTKDGTTCEEDRENLCRLRARDLEISGRNKIVTNEETSGSAANFLDEPRYSAEKTFVKLSSAYLRRFLSKGGGKTEGVVVGMDPIESQYTIAMTCLKLLCDDHLYSKYSNSSIMAYAARYFHEHLRTALHASKVISLPFLEHITLSDQLIKIFTEKTISFRHISHLLSWPRLDHWAVTKDQIEVFREWFDNPNSHSTLDVKDREWMSKAKEDPTKELLQLTARGAVRAWLENVTQDPFKCFSYAYSYLAAVRNNATADHLPLTRSGR